MNNLLQAQNATKKNEQRVERNWKKTKEMHAFGGHKNQSYGLQKQTFTDRWDRQKHKNECSS